MSKKLLIISPFFHPEPISTGRYNTYLAEELVRRGISVDVICFHPLYPDWRPHKSRATLPRIRIFRGGDRIKYPIGNVLRRLTLEICFLVHVIRFRTLIKQHSQIVTIIPPMLLLPVARCIAGRGTRLTVIVHDLQGIMARADSRKNRLLSGRLVKIIEAVMLRYCDRVVALSKSMALFLRDEYNLSSSKIVVCWPFVTMKVNRNRFRLKHLFQNNKRHIVYAGALGEKQNPMGLVSFFLKMIGTYPDAVCHIFSRGPIFDVIAVNKEMEHPRLQFHDLVLEHDLFELYQCSDIQVIPERIGFSSGAMPSKLPNLLASGVPILYIGGKNSDQWQVIEKYGGGMCADTWEAEKLCRIAGRLLAECSGRSHADRRQGFNASIRTRFSIDPLIKELVG